MNTWNANALREEKSKSKEKNQRTIQGASLHYNLWSLREEDTCDTHCIAQGRGGNQEPLDSVMQILTKWKAKDGF